MTGMSELSKKCDALQKFVDAVERRPDGRNNKQRMDDKINHMNNKRRQKREFELMQQPPSKKRDEALARLRKNLYGIEF
jgi:hypothetical protein